MILMAKPESLGLLMAKHLRAPCAIVRGCEAPTCHAWIPGETGELVRKTQFVRFRTTWENVRQVSDQWHGLPFGGFWALEKSAEGGTRALGVEESREPPSEHCLTFCET